MTSFNVSSSCIGNNIRSHLIHASVFQILRILGNPRIKNNAAIDSNLLKCVARSTNNSPLKSVNIMNILHHCCLRKKVPEVVSQE
jgi:hypothetical protein